MIKSELGFNAALHKVRSGQLYSSVSWAQDSLIVPHISLLKQQVLCDPQVARELADQTCPRLSSLIEIFRSHNCGRLIKLKIIELFAAILSQRSIKSVRLPQDSVSELNSRASMSQVLLNLLNHEYRCRADLEESGDSVSLKID
jgi:hypothetical protein